ncbi:MAG: hypothetical protein KKE20_04385, partial [Nanoarchaeota archaeon]|nr:hypothetical protein [Nanoarchaeota archaeon]
MAKRASVILFLIIFSVFLVSCEYDVDLAGEAFNAVNYRNQASTWDCKIINSRLSLDLQRASLVEDAMITNGCLDEKQFFAEEILPQLEVFKNNIVSFDCKKLSLMYENHQGRIGVLNEIVEENQCGPKIKKGDADGDGIIGPGDIAKMDLYIAGMDAHCKDQEKNEIDCLIVFDMDSDGKVDSYDKGLWGALFSNTALYCNIENEDIICSDYEIRTDGISIVIKNSNPDGFVIKDINFITIGALGSVVGDCMNPGVNKEVPALSTIKFDFPCNTFKEQAGQIAELEMSLAVTDELPVTPVEPTEEVVKKTTEIIAETEEEIVEDAFTFVEDTDTDSDIVVIEERQVLIVRGSMTGIIKEGVVQLSFCNDNGVCEPDLGEGIGCNDCVIQACESVMNDYLIPIGQSVVFDCTSSHEIVLNDVVPGSCVLSVDGDAVSIAGGSSQNVGELTISVTDVSAGDGFCGFSVSCDNCGVQRELCTDTDATPQFPDGKNFNVVGVCNDSLGRSFVDSCNPNVFGRVNEAFCENDRCNFVAYDDVCPDGCVDGSCVGAVAVCNNNEQCEADLGENAENCPGDCAALPQCDNDGVCDPGETAENCGDCKEQAQPFIFSKTMGPGGGIVRALTISESEPNILVAGTDATGWYITEDGGMNWEDIGIPHVPGAENGIGIDYNDPNNIYIGNINGIYTSHDKGGEWKKTFSREDFRPECEGIIGEGGGMCGMGISRSDTSILFAGTMGGCIYKSVDSGETWEFSGKVSDYMVHTLLFHPENPDIAYVATGYWDLGGTRGTGGEEYPGPGEGMFKTTDGGHTWFPINNGIPTWFHKDWQKELITVNGLAMDLDNPDILYASINRWDSLYKTTNGGQDWSKVIGLGNTIDSIAIDPTNTSTIYCSNQKNNLKKSTDGGQTWNIIRGTQLTNNPFFLRMVVDPKNPSNVYGASYYKGVLKSSDYGETWNRSSNGLNTLTTYFVKADPLDSNTAYAGPSESALFKTGNGGDLWEFVFEFISYGYIYGILTDPETDPITMYVGIGWQGGSTNAGMFKSEDAGQTWKQIIEGMGERAVSIVNERLNFKCNTWACNFFYDTEERSNSALGVQKEVRGGSLSPLSPDGVNNEIIFPDDPYSPTGSIWIPVSPGETYNINYRYKGHFSNFDILLNSDQSGETIEEDLNNRDGRLGGSYSILYRDSRWDDPTRFLFKDASFSFTIPEDGESIAIRVDTIKDTISYFDDISLTKEGSTTNILENGDFSEGLNHWSYPIGQENINIYYLEIDPNDHQTVYAGTETGIVYKTTNGGEDWKNINGIMNFDPINIIQTHPNDPDTIFVGSNSKYSDGG